MVSKYSPLLKDKDVRRWYDNVARGAHTTAGVYLRRLGAFCVTHHISPRQLIDLKDREKYNLLLDTVSEMEKRKHAGGYIATVVKVVKSWLSFNGHDVKGRIMIRGTHETPTLQDERVPTQEELKNIFLAGDEKSRTICVLLAHSGLRPEVLGNYNGKDGLRLRDLPELTIDTNKVNFLRVPTLVKVRTVLSKKGHEYLTFLSDEGCQYLKSYLERRMRMEEQLEPDSAIITPKTADKDFITTVNISDSARSAIRKAGFSCRPYVLRSYFATQMMLAESKGLVIRDYRTFFMGHKGDIEAVYTVNKKRLPTAVVEQMRESFMKAQKYLQTVETEKVEDIRRAFKRQLLLIAGFKQEDIKDEHLELGEDDFQQLVRERLVAELQNHGTRQRVVDLNQVESHLSDGWEYVGSLPNNKAILKLPELA